MVQLITLLSDGDTYDGVDGSEVLALTDEGYEQCLNSSGAKSIEDGQIIARLNIVDLLEAYDKVHGTNYITDDEAGVLKI